MTDYAAKITALEDAIGNGVLTVESDGERITYRNMKELFQALDYNREKLAAESAIQRPASTVAVFDPN